MIRKRWKTKGKTEDEQFWERVEFTETCWLWNGHRRRHGYGEFVTDEGKRVTASRWIAERFLSDWSPELFACHSCDNPPCVNPEHLFMGTAKDNAADMQAKGRGSRYRAGPKSYVVSRQGKGKLNRAGVEMVADLLAGGLAPYRIAKFFEYSPSSIQDIKNGKTWRGVLDGYAPIPMRKFPENI
jgi:hypothetical protein